MYLRLELHRNAGIVRCCPHLVTLPVEPVAACKCCENYTKVEINVTDMSDYIKGTSSFNTVDSNYLHEPFTKDMLTHDPYTPESIESHSPLPEEKRESVVTKKQSVSPRILKSRLENILRSEHINDDDTDDVFYTNDEKNKEVSDSRLLGYVFPENKKLSSTKNLSKILQDNKFTHHKLCHTQSEIPNRFVKHRPCRLLSKSQSQHLERNFEEPEGFRKRCFTEVTRKTSRARLIGADRAASITRLQSHHSSSDEEWFEFEEIDVVEQIEDTNSDEKIDGVSIEKKVEVKEEGVVKEEKKIKKKQMIDACCCIC